MYKAIIRKTKLGNEKHPNANKQWKTETNNAIQKQSSRKKKIKIKERKKKKQNGTNVQKSQSSNH